MISIVRVVGDTLDLQSGKEFGSGFMLSNGRDEMFLPAEPDQVRAVVEFWASTRMSEIEEEAEELAGLSEEREPPPVSEELIRRAEDEIRAMSAAAIRGAPMPAYVEDNEYEDREPGEMYEEPETGVASI